ncbi:alpha-N-acetylglucosaminidase [Dyella flava]|uniref:Alpha-N-acetylglucosaminidase n=1 Tax=Dyella flava TaxID=1920170 RepID=A0ABS2JYB3_9GAMM|nr:alpha-N-acetylglucosaminidase [Dyella flava]MBM7123871.1 alpha-N-acetylglucosaminidase [Dyella flava]GLQ52607.1 alpha-N-acetylglucosaminidase [Dyella flava]
MRRSTASIWLASLLWLAWSSAVCAADAASFDTRPEHAVLERLLPHQAAQLELGTLAPREGHERFRISSAQGHIKVEGSTPSALLFGVNWYLKYIAHVQISPNGDRVGTQPFPLPTATIERETPYAYRYALNENVDGYTAPYWDWPRWQREIDVLALSGINAVLVERGMDSVLYQTFRDVGYSDDEIRQWITQPAHQNWELMGNMCCFNGPISSSLMQKRAASAQKIVARLRELGITPVLPGFYGIVPADFQKKFPHAHVVPQGEWAGFTRPGWLDPRDLMFARLAAAFYKHQRALFGDSSVYDMEVFQEGGDSGDVPVPEAARDVQNALLAAHPGARWMMLAWQGNPRQDLLTGVDRQHLLIIDIDHDRVPRDNRQKDFQNAPFLFGGIWEFGGRTTLGANTRNITERLQRLGRTNSNMVGTAVFTEGMDTNPFAFDLFTEMAWRSEPVDTAQWSADYVQRRYGAADPHALAAWKVLLNTAYDIRIDAVVFNSERDAAQESLFNAQPSLDANRASNWSPEAMRYSAEAFKQALPELLQVAPALRESETYQYDLVDVARQTLANESRLLLPQIKAAYDSKDRAQFEALTRRWLQLMDLQDELLATNRFFLVGSWLAQVDAWAATPEERTRLDYDARSILTTWGDRKASEGASLHDYGNKDWAGLTRDYYRLRWETYFNALDQTLRTGVAAKPIDWFAMGDAWNHGSVRYPEQPTGDAYTIASLVAQALRLRQP